jgi:hypothetical protein
VTNHVDNQHHVIPNAKLHRKYFLEIFQKDIEGGIETANKFSLIFPIEKGGESGSINFSHPLTLLQTNTACTIGFIDSIHKEKVETPLVFELSLVGITGVSADFAPANITPTTNQVFSNPSTSTHTTHSSYTAGSEFNYLDDKFYYDSEQTGSLTLEQPSTSARTMAHSPTLELSTRQSSQAQGKMQ